MKLMVKLGAVFIMVVNIIILSLSFILYGVQFFYFNSKLSIMEFITYILVSIFSSTLIVYVPAIIVKQFAKRSKEE